MQSPRADALDFCGIEDALDFMNGMILPNAWWDWLRKGINEVLQRHSKLVTWGCEGKGTAMGIEHYCVRDLSVLCTWDVTPVIPIMVQGRANIKAMGAMWCLSESIVGRVMDDNFAA